MGLVKFNHFFSKTKSRTFQVNVFRMSGLIMLLGFCFVLPLQAQDESELLDALKTATESGKPEAQVEALYRLGLFYNNNDSVSKSIQYTQKAIDLGRQLPPLEWTARALNLQACTYSESGTSDTINAMFQEATDLFLSFGDTARAAGVLINLGMEYINMGLYEKGLETKQLALDYKLRSKDSTNICFFYQQIGEAYKVLKMNDKWKYYLEKARDLAQNPSYARFLSKVSILNDLGGIYADEEKYADALQVYQEMIRISIENNYPQGVSTANANLVEVYFALNDPDKALRAALKHYEMSRDASAYRQISSVENLASCYLNKGDFRNAERYFQMAVSHPSVSQYVEVLTESLKGMSETAAALGKFEEAYHFRLRYEHLNDSLAAVEVKKNISLLETTFQTREKEQRVQLLTAENAVKDAELARLNTWILVGLVALMLFVLLVYLAWRQHQLAALHKRMVLEQKLLRSQMNPHFIFNALAAIQQQLRNGNAGPAAELLASFATLMRSVLKGAREDWISLDEELTQLRSYLEIQQLRFQSHLHFSLHCDPTLETDILILPPLMIQPFVENAIEHGISKRDTPGTLQIVFEDKGEHLRVLIDDDGLGLNGGASKENHLGYATSIFKERMKLLNKSMRKRVVFQLHDKAALDSATSGVQVEIWFPVLTAKDI